MELVWRDAYTNAIVIYQDKVAPHNFGEGTGIMRILLPRLSGSRGRGRNLDWGCITMGQGGTTVIIIEDIILAFLRTD